MKILALNTAGPTVEVALSCGGFYRDEDGRNASAALMPAVDKILSDAGLSIGDLDRLACVVGPGSFTGIRIGVSAVRAMSYASAVNAVPLNYLQMLAYNERADGYDRILCVTDGANGTAYIAEFDGDRREISPCRCMSMVDACALANTYSGAVCVDEKTAPRLPNAIAPDKECASLIRAASALSANAVGYRDIVPLYIRESQAEKDLKERKTNA